MDPYSLGTNHCTACGLRADTGIQAVTLCLILTGLNSVRLSCLVNIKSGRTTLRTEHYNQHTYEHLYMSWVGSRLCTYSVFLIVLILELGLKFNNFIIVPVTDGDVMRTL